MLPFGTGRGPYAIVAFMRCVLLSAVTVTKQCTHGATVAWQAEYYKIGTSPGGQHTVNVGDAGPKYINGFYNHRPMV